MLDINVETQSLKSTDSVVSDNVTEAVGAYDMQTSIAYIKAGFRNSVSDELVVEKPG